MINPGGTPGTSFSKSAQTRFNNNEINAARATMPFNQAAQASLRNMSSTGKAVGPPVGPKPDISSLLPQVQNQPVRPSAPQVSQPLVREPASQPLDQVTETKNLADDLVKQVRQDQFINSPQVKDAMTSIRLRNLFNASNPDAMPDNRDLMTRIKARIGDL